MVYCRFLHLLIHDVLIVIALLVFKESESLLEVLFPYHDGNSKLDKLQVELKLRLLLCLQKDQICDIHDFGLEAKLFADKKH